MLQAGSVSYGKATSYLPVIGRESQERAELLLGQPGLLDDLADGERGELAVVEGNDQTPGRGPGARR